MDRVWHELDDLDLDIEDGSIDAAASFRAMNDMARDAAELKKLSPSNKVYAEYNEVFRRACVLARVEPTARQAGKFRRNVGLASFHRAEARRWVE